ncbi:hypothetical protein HanIR_Chr10g0454431 [Helianthus annuus]|nr:hypothetical protein HanIR_Chr10g0454431 [Helianthus annuus]
MVPYQYVFFLFSIDVVFSLSITISSIGTVTNQIDTDLIPAAKRGGISLVKIIKQKIKIINI